MVRAPTIPSIGAQVYPLFGPCSSKVRVVAGFLVRKIVAVGSCTRRHARIPVEPNKTCGLGCIHKVKYESGLCAAVEVLRFRIRLAAIVVCSFSVHAWAFFFNMDEGCLWELMMRRRLCTWTSGDALVSHMNLTLLLLPCNEA